MSAQDNPGSARKITIAERRSLALDLRKEGWTYEQIGVQIQKEAEGVSESYGATQAYRDVMAELAKINKQNESKAGELRALESERLNEIIATFYPRAVNGDYGAADRVFGAHDRLVRLWGLLKPTQIRPDKDGGVTVEGGDGASVSGPPIMIYIPDNGRGDSGATKTTQQPPTTIGAAGDIEEGE